ncbi:MAG: 2-hydroxymuconate tautomerase family protein [Actinobacteria bacterium]|uniref:Unannotated protein n=1 Tax=freshwater metagenome TaxID=449393 RepID=A0A6J5Z6Q8_9ZZZZ|nr:2-hydroxymuconate tautomerase family protein [Actinomycetota bacterium]
MPFIQITLVEGRSVQQKRDLIAQVTQAAIDTVNATPENVRIAIYEVSADEWGVAGQTVADMRAADAT